MSFVEQLDEKSLETFNRAANMPCSQQAVFFLNAFWDEFQDQAEFIYAISNRVFQRSDMKCKNISYVHQYQEGSSLDFDMGIYLFEQVCKFWDDPTHEAFRPWGFHSWYNKNKDFQSKFAKSKPEMMTSITRKKELKDKVDVNFDGRVSMIEFLLYQYKASPKDLVTRSMNTNVHEEIRKAMQALKEVQDRVNAYEAEKHRLEEGSKEAGVKGLKCKNELAQLNSSPLWESINRALITAEAAVRIATKKFGKGGSHADDGSSGGARTEGSIWWMNRDLDEKKELYGSHKKE